MKKKSQFTEEQLITVLREAEAGVDMQEICRKHGISDTTFSGERSEHGVQKLSKARRLKQLEDENQRLKSLVADLTLRNQALKRVVSKKW